VYSLLAGIVYLVSHSREIGIDAGEDQIIIHLVEQIAQGGGVAVASAHKTAECGGDFLFDGLFKHRAAHDGTRGE